MFFLNNFNFLRRFDVWLFLSILILYCFSLAEIYALSLTNFNMALFWRHLIFGLVGFVFYFLMSFVPYHQSSTWARVAYPFLITSLSYLLLFSRDIKGSTRWIDFGLFSFQPSEFIKLIIILVISRVIWKARGAINHPLSIIKTLLLVSIPAVFVLVQPDLGSAMILVLIWASLLFVSHIKLSYVAILVGAGLILSVFSWQYVLKDYQKHRVHVLIDPALDPQGKGYNVKQAMIAVGSGGVFGKGLGKGLQSRLNFLPERQTDFIFATTAEEVGLLGSGIILMLYLLILFRLRVIAHKAKDYLGFYITYGVMFMIFFQVLINIGMNIGVMPVTGIPLPLFSYGGSSLLTTLMAFGIAQNIAYEASLGKYG